MVGVTVTLESTPPAEMKPPVPAVPLAEAVFDPVDSIDTLPALVTLLPVSILASVVPVTKALASRTVAPMKPPAPPSVVAVAKFVAPAVALIAPVMATDDVPPNVAEVVPATSALPSAMDTPARPPIEMTKSSVLAVRCAVALRPKELGATPLSIAEPLKVTVLEPLASMVETMTDPAPTRPADPPLE